MKMKIRKWKTLARARFYGIGRLWGALGLTKNYDSKAGPMNWYLVESHTNVAHNHAPTLRLSLRLFSLSRSFFFSLNLRVACLERARDSKKQSVGYTTIFFQKLSKQFCVCVCVCVCVMEREKNGKSSVYECMIQDERKRESKGQDFFFSDSCEY